MKNVTEHQRPGVYSVFSASSVTGGDGSGGAVGIVVMSPKGSTGNIYTLHSYQDVVDSFGAATDPIVKLCGVLLSNGAATVYAIPVTAENAYAAAFTKLERVEGIQVVTCDSVQASVHQTLRDSVRKASGERRERLGVVSAGGELEVSPLMQKAGAINDERMVLVAGGGVEGAAAVAGAIAAESDPAVPLGGAELKGEVSVDGAWSENDIDLLVKGGVTALESVGGTARVIRAVTTRTKTNSATDYTWRELTTIRVVDDVIPGLRNTLQAKFSRSKNTEQSRGAIRSQVIVELERKKSQEIITGYDGVTVREVEGNPTVCMVEFRFTVAHGLNQIWLSANITV